MSMSACRNAGIPAEVRASITALQWLVFLHMTAMSPNPRGREPSLWTVYLPDPT